MSETCCQPYLEEDYQDECNFVEASANPRRLADNDTLITRPVKTIYKPAVPGNNPYEDLFNQGIPKVEKLSSHDILVIYLTGGMITVALIVGGVLVYVAHKRATRAAKYSTLQDPSSMVSQ
jgi:hypothetical protein